MQSSSARALLKGSSTSSRSAPERSAARASALRTCGFGWLGGWVPCPQAAERCGAGAPSVALRAHALRCSQIYAQRRKSCMLWLHKQSPHMSQSPLTAGYVALLISRRSPGASASDAMTALTSDVALVPGTTSRQSAPTRAATCACSEWSWFAWLQTKEGCRRLCEVGAWHQGLGAWHHVPPVGAHQGCYLRVAARVAKRGEAGGRVCRQLTGTGSTCWQQRQPQTLAAALATPWSSELSIISIGYVPTCCGCC